jgi:hypothetical protein
MVGVLPHQGTNLWPRRTKITSHKACNKQVHPDRTSESWLPAKIVFNCFPQPSKSRTDTGYQTSVKAHRGSSSRSESGVSLAEHLGKPLVSWLVVNVGKAAVRNAHPPVGTEEDHTLVRKRIPGATTLRDESIAHLDD